MQLSEGQNSHVHKMPSSQDPQEGLILLNAPPREHAVEGVHQDAAVQLLDDAASPCYTAAS